MNKEKFFERVKDKFLARMKDWDKDEINSFIDGDEAKEVILQEYEYNEENIRSKPVELSEESYWQSAIGSTVQCLTLLL